MALIGRAMMPADDVLAVIVRLSGVDHVEVLMWVLSDFGGDERWPRGAGIVGGDLVNLEECLGFAGYIRASEYGHAYADPNYQDRVARARASLCA